MFESALRPQSWQRHPLHHARPVSFWAQTTWQAAILALYLRVWVRYDYWIIAGVLLLAVASWVFVFRAYLDARREVASDFMARRYSKRMSNQVMFVAVLYLVLAIAYFWRL